MAADVGMDFKGRIKLTFFFLCRVNGVLVYAQF